MIISKEERAEWREKHGNGNMPFNFGHRIIRLLDALEAAEARAEAAERERGALIGHILGYKVVNPDCPRDMGHSCALNHGHSEFDSIVCERETIEEIRQCWLEWARQQARGETKNA